ncbi:hypothetical protein D3C73_850860 [compost metagenome]
MHQADLGRTRLEVVAMAFAQHQEPVAVGQGLAVRAACRQHAQPFRPGFAREHVAQFVGGLDRVFREEHAAAAGRFRKLPGRHFGQVGTLLEPFVVFANLPVGPRRGHQRQARHRQGNGNRHAQHGP